MGKNSLASATSSGVICGICRSSEKAVLPFENACKVIEIRRPILLSIYLNRVKCPFYKYGDYIALDQKNQQWWILSNYLKRNPLSTICGYGKWDDHR